jgi:hypothetical protein
METIADDRMGVPVIGLLKDPLTFLLKANEGLEEAKRYRAGEPNGGVIMVDNVLKNPTDEPKTFYKEGSGLPVRALDIPDEQESISFEDAIPKVQPGNVVYSGTFDGSATFPRSSNCPECGSVVSHFEYSVIITGTLTANVGSDGGISGTLQFSGEWSSTGTSGCPHIVCLPSNGPLSLSQPVSGKTSGFTARGTDTVGGINGSMDPDSVTGHLEIRTTDGSFTVLFTLTPE